MKAIVHIGTEKTGTTTIQNFLYHNRRKLRRLGIHFVESAGEKNNRALPAYCLDDERPDDFYRDLGITTLEDRLLYKRKFIREFEKELVGLPEHIHTVVISSEHFHSRIRTVEEMNNVQSLLGKYFDDVEIVCYLRDQVSTCTSYYSTALKSGSTSSFSEFVKCCTPRNHYFNYLAMLENWERCFGVDALNVSLFSSKHFINGDLLDDFTAKLSADLVGKLDTSVSAENESLTPAGQVLARAINVAFPLVSMPATLEALRNECRRVLTRNFEGRGRQLSADSQSTIHGTFRDMNEAIRLKFFPTEDKILHPPPVADEVVELVDEAFVTGLSALMKIVRTEGPAVLDEHELSRVYRVFFNSINDLHYCSDQEEVKSAAIARDRQHSLGDFPRNVKRRDNPVTSNLLGFVKSFDPTAPGAMNRLGKSVFREKALPETKNRAKAEPTVYILRFSIGSNRWLDATDGKDNTVFRRRFSDWCASLDESAVGGAVNATDQTRIFTAQGKLPPMGPSIETGFSIIRVASAQKAESIAAACPLLEIGGVVELSLLAPSNSSGMIRSA